MIAIKGERTVTLHSNRTWGGIFARVLRSKALPSGSVFRDVSYQAFVSIGGSTGSLDIHSLTFHKYDFRPVPNCP